jgi:hypothetical protein
VFCLVGSLSVPSGAATGISIAADDVTLDLAGFTIDNGAAGPDTQALGILATNAHRLIVRNGRVKGFSSGVVLRDGGSHNLVDGLEIASSLYAGIEIGTPDSEVRNCRILDTGGSTTSGFQAIGIGVSADRIRVDGNRIDNVFAVSNEGPPGGIVAIAINISGSAVRVANSYIRGIGGSSYVNYGIACNLAGTTRISGNDISAVAAPGSAWSTTTCVDLGGNSSQ